MFSMRRKVIDRSLIGTSNKQRRRGWHRLIRWGIVICVLGVLWALYVLARIGSVDQNPAASANQAQAEVGIVLGASLWGDVPSPGLEERLQLSLKDYQAGKFKMFILTGGRDTRHSTYTEAEGMANYLEKHGVPRSKMLLENQATSTYENLKFSQQMMKERGYTSALIITHTFHGNRALEIAEALHYSTPRLSLTKSQVLKPIPNTFREILAYTKWKLDQIGLVLRQD